MFARMRTKMIDIDGNANFEHESISELVQEVKDAVVDAGDVGNRLSFENV